MAAEIVGGAQRRTGRQQFRAACREDLVCEQQVDIEPRVNAAAVTDRDVEIAPGQIDDLIGRGDPHVDFGVLLLKPVQPQHQPFGGDRRRGGDGQACRCRCARAAAGPRIGCRQRLPRGPGSRIRADAVSSIERFRR